MPDNTPPNAAILPTEISSEMKKSYLNYAMSVIVSRALPDIRDGLKPVHRRIIYAMHRLGLSHTASYSKSAKVVGEVLGKYHPHGDSPVYDSLVRLAQVFSMRYPLIKGQGNFGSIDGDPPAAMRYTEVKLEAISHEMLIDLDKDTVSWSDNFDASLLEPDFLPAKLPNLLLMGAEGIAVGMATKIPPHNLSELIDAIQLLITKTRVEKSADKSEIKTAISDLSRLIFDCDLESIMEHVKGPDFPTAGIIYGMDDIRSMYATGRGKILVRGKFESEDMGKGKDAIIIEELPYQVNKATLIEKIANLVRDKKIVGISDLRDESNREGIRVVIELKRDAVYRKVVNNLLKHTELQTTFPANIVVLVDGTPQTLGLKTILELYIKHRIQIIYKRSQFELSEAKSREHILRGLLIALDHIDEIIETIKKSKSEGEARENLMIRFKLSQIQAQAILDMQLKRLTGLERNKIEDELAALMRTIAYLTELVTDIFKILKVIVKELTELKEKFGDERRTKIFKYKPGEFSEEELIENKKVIISLTKEGYIKHVPRETFKTQKRGGKGVTGFSTKEEDNVSYITSAMMHDAVLFFTDKGKVYQTRVWDIPLGSRVSKGKALINLINILPDEKITSVLTYSQEDGKTEDSNKGKYILMCTKNGTAKKTDLSEYAHIRGSGKIAIKLESGDNLKWVKITDGKKLIVLSTRKGKAIVFSEGQVRSTGRDSIGVGAIKLIKDDEVISMDIYDKEDKNKKILVLTKRGIGKQTKMTLFRPQRRGGMGVKLATLDEKTGDIVFSSTTEETFETLIITSSKGQTMKIPLNTVPTLSRSAKGVILMRFSNGKDMISSATFV